MVLPKSAPVGGTLPTLKTWVERHMAAHHNNEADYQTTQSSANIPFLSPRYEHQALILRISVQASTIIVTEFLRTVAFTPSTTLSVLIISETLTKKRRKVA